MQEFVGSFLTVLLLIQISCLVLLTPNCMSTQIFHFKENRLFISFKRHTGRIPDVHSVCFENQQATDCYKWD